MEQVLYEASDPVTLDTLAVERDGDRLLVRSTIDGRECVAVLVRGRDEALRLAVALLDAFATGAA